MRLFCSRIRRKVQFTMTHKDKSPSGQESGGPTHVEHTVSDGGEHWSSLEKEGSRKRKKCSRRTKGNIIIIIFIRLAQMSFHAWKSPLLFSAIVAGQPLSVPIFYRSWPLAAFFDAQCVPKAPAAKEGMYLAWKEVECKIAPKEKKETLPSLHTLFSRVLRNFFDSFVFVRSTWIKEAH